jgi:hypothetical protein
MTAKLSSLAEYSCIVCAYSCRTLAIVGDPENAGSVRGSICTLTRKKSTHLTHGFPKTCGFVTQWFRSYSITRLRSRRSHPSAPARLTLTRHSEMTKPIKHRKDGAGRSR